MDDMQVMDNGEPMLSSICTVLVEFSDVNENLFPPVFDDIAQETGVYGENYTASALKVSIIAKQFNTSTFHPLWHCKQLSHDFAENMPVWSEVLALNAVDVDSPESPVKYTIIDGDGSSFFTIDSEGIEFKFKSMGNSFSSNNMFSCYPWQ